jgi:hypothetical protein
VPVPVPTLFVPVPTLFVPVPTLFVPTPLLSLDLYVVLLILGLADTAFLLSAMFYYINIGDNIYIILFNFKINISRYFLDIKTFLQFF